MRNITSIIFPVILTSSIVSNKKSFAQEMFIVTENVPAELERLNDGNATGIFGEIVTEALERKKIKYQFVWTRWKTAQKRVQENKDKKTFILPLTRIPEREKMYHWVAKICDIETIFITRKGNKKINSLSEISEKKIGVQIGTSYEQKILNQKGIAFKDEVEAVPFDQLNVKKLILGEIYSWYTSTISGKANIMRENIDIQQFEFGNKIDIEENYVATTKDTDPKLIEKVRQAFDDFRKTKRYNEIIKKYIPSRN